MESNLVGLVFRQHFEGWIYAGIFSAIQSNDLKLSFHVSQQVEDLPGSVLLLGGCQRQTK